VFSFIFAVLLSFLGSSVARAQPKLEKVAVVVDGADEQASPISEKVAKSIHARAEISVYDLSRINLPNPIEKGKFLASLEAKDLIVAVGDGATEFVTHEMEDVPIYFADVGLIKGDQLSAPSTTGIFSYNVGSLLDAVKKLGEEKIGVAYTPGYAPVAGWIRKGASERGLLLSEKKISDLKDLAPAIRDLMEHSQAIWVVGDPLLVRGAGFQFLTERALSNKVPIIAAGLWEVQHGAFMAFEPAADPLASEAAKAVDSILNGQAGQAPRLQPAPASGVLLVNGTLAEKWKLQLPEGTTWRTVR